MTDPESQKQSTLVDEFNSLMSAISAHNHEFSVGSSMGKALVGIFHRNQKVFEKMNSDFLPREEAERVIFEEEQNAPGVLDERDMSHDVLELTNAPVLSELGLKITPFRTEATLMTQGTTQEFGPVHLQLEDGDKFSDFLLSIDPSALTDELKNNIDSVIANFLNELSDGIVNHTEGDFIVEALSSSSRIMEGLKHLGLDGDPLATRFAAYSEHAKKGDLTEFVLGNRLQLFRKPEDQQFGPSQWQGDATPEYLQKRWEEVINLLRQAKTNPHGQDIFRELMGGAKISLETARVDWKVLRAKYAESGHGSYGAGFEGIFNEVGAKLQELEQA